MFVYVKNDCHVTLAADVKNTHSIKNTHTHTVWVISVSMCVNVGREGRA